MKEKYKAQIEVYCGLEFDMYSDDDMQGYDYLIGTDGVVDLFGYPREMENFIL